MKNIKKKKFGKALMASVALPAIALLASPETAHANDAVSVTLDSSTQKTIESSQLRVWLKNDGRYGIQLKSNGATIFYGQDSAHVYVLRSGNFPTSGLPSNFNGLALKSFVVNGTTIEQTRTDGTFDYILRISIVNATSQGAYMKAELEMKNLTSVQQNVGASFNIDTMVNGNDASPFRIIPNGWEAFHNGVQVTAYYRDVFNVTNADSIYLGMYNAQYPMPISSFTNGQVIYPGDSGAGFYYNLKAVAPYASRKESWIMGMGPRNVNPTFVLTAPSDDQTFYRGQTLQIAGTARDTDIGDRLDVKWSIDGGAENIISSFTANGSDQSFNQSYTLPNNLADGWHTLQVWVMDDKGGVSSSNTKRFFINNFTSPGSPTYSNIGNNSFTVAFDKKGNVSSTTYELYREHNKTTVNMGTESSRVETGLLPNTRYEYKVRAKNTSNEYTAYSALTSIYTLANQPTAGNLVTSVLGQATLSWNANGNPSGTVYQYEIRKVSDNSVVKSGSTASTSATVTSLATDIQYRAYVKAVNGDNKPTSETYLGEILQDTINPSLVLSTSSTEWTSGEVRLTASASDSGTGVKRIQLPNGNWTTASTVDYVVNSNGGYTFLVEDNAGNVSSKTIQVTNIDKDKPVATHTIDHVDADTYRVTLQATDKTSGVKHIKLPNGQISNGTTATYLVKKGESYNFEVQDVAGNTLNYSVKVDIPELNVYQKDNHVKAEWAIEMLEEDVLIRTSFENGDSMMPSFPAKLAVQYQEGASYVEVNDSRNVEFRRYATGWVDKSYFEEGKGATSMSYQVGSNYTNYYKLKDGRYRLEQVTHTNGVQEISSTEAYDGTRSYKVGTTTPKLGNFFFFPSINTGTSYGTFPTLYAIQNGMDLSLSFRAKTDATATIETVAHGGMSSWTYPFHEKYGMSKPITVSKPASKGSNRIYINGIEQMNPAGIYYVTNRTSQTERINHFYYRILTVNKEEGYIEIQGTLTDDWATGYVLQTHVNRTPVNFHTRTIQNSDGWRLFNVNAKVENYEDYNSSLLGLILWFKTISSGNTYIDDVKMGFATKAQLFRGTEKVYEGLLSDYEDKEATDKAKPNTVDQIQVSPKNGKVFMQIQPPSDNGTEYEYTVKAVSNKGDLVASEKKKALVTSGVDGYSYVVDTNAGTIPDNTIDSKATDIEIPVTTNAKYYIHIKTIDKAGNVSEVKHIPFQDNIAPEMVLSQNPTTWTNTGVQLNATASDSGLGVKRIQLPSGTWVNGETASYNVTTNGTYTFVVEDLVGNKTTKSITVTNIDKTNPTSPTIINNQEWTRITPVPVSIVAGTDSQSGVKHVEYKLEGATVKGWTTYIGSFQIVNEGETRVIARTVDNLGHLSEEQTAFVRIDLSPPHNVGITIKLKP